MSVFTDLVFEAGLVARSLGDYFSGGGLRLGVTGLSRSGKTVFVTALVNNLIAGARLPVLAASAEGRITRARLEPQPDDAVPRFPYEENLASLSGPDRRWPQSTRRISELRLTIEFESAAGWSGRSSSLSVDLVDYPGEWLLDLPLIDKSFAQWAQETLEASETPARAPLSADWRAALKGLDPQAQASEDAARDIAKRFTAYLRRARDDVYALSTLPPGRFLMPGDLESSPALTFAPIPLGESDAIAPGSLAAMMERRYEAYKAHVVRPFFRDHFARLDRQIVLVDALTALNSGPAALSDLENALADVLRAFRAGRSSRFASIFRPRIDRILFAATKADHLHHTSHDRLEAILRALTARAIARAEGSAPRSTSSRSPPSARRARPKSGRGARRCRRSSACPRGARRSAAILSTGRSRPPCSPANCPPIRCRSSRAKRSRAPKPTATGASSASGRLSSSAASRRPRSGSTARSNS